MKIPSFQLVRLITSQSTLHAPPMQHAYTLLLPSISNIRDDSIQSYYVHGNKKVVQLDKKPVLKIQ
jgi:hypothetical protein